MFFYLIFLGIGLFCLCVGLFNLESFFVDPESRVIEAIGGERAVRWYWGLIGLVIIGMTVWYWIKD